MTTQENTAKTKRGDLTSAEKEMLQVAAAGIRTKKKHIFIFKIENLILFILYY